eukprot:290481-Chlamydomonas_euryale.AAC.3
MTEGRGRREGGERRRTLTRAHPACFVPPPSIPQAVMADGKVVNVDAGSGAADLLWALRGGGGGNVAAVVEFVVRTVEVPVVNMLHYDPGTEPTVSSPLGLGFRV